MSTRRAIIYLTDRAAFMIISGGVNIYPQECENLLVTHPKVADAAVFGVPNEEIGEEVKAVVQLMPGVEPGPRLEAELIAFCREHLAHIKCPRSIDFEDGFPAPPDRQALQDSRCATAIGRATRAGSCEFLLDASHPSISAVTCAATERERPSRS